MNLDHLEAMEFEAAQNKEFYDAYLTNDKFCIVTYPLSQELFTPALLSEGSSSDTYRALWSSIPAENEASIVTYKLRTSFTTLPLIASPQTMPLKGADELSNERTMITDKV